MASFPDPAALLPKIVTVLIHKGCIEVYFDDGNNLKLYLFTINGVWSRIEWSNVEDVRYRTLATLEEMIASNDAVQYTVTAIGLKGKITQQMYFKYLWAAFIRLKEMSVNGTKFQKDAISELVKTLDIAKYLLLAVNLVPTKVEVV